MLIKIVAQFLFVFRLKKNAEQALHWKREL